MTSPQQFHSIYQMSFHAYLNMNYHLSMTFAVSPNPRIRLEYNRVNTEINSYKAQLSNIIRTYQDFCDRNLELKMTEDELLLRAGELESVNYRRLFSTIVEKHISKLHENIAEILASTQKLSEQYIYNSKILSWIFKSEQ